MKIQTVAGVLAVAGVAFAAGMHWSSATTTAMAANPQQDVPPEIPPGMTPEMMEKMKAWEEVGQPGLNHKYLEDLAGTWEGSFRMWMAPGTEPMESAGTVERKWVLNGRFLKETMHAVGPMGEFHGLGYVGFNNIDGRYEFVWLEDQSTAIMFGTGSFDPDEKVFRWHGEHKEPGGRVVDSWSRLEMPSPSHHVYKGWQIGPDGKKFKSFEGEVTRK